MRPNPFRRRETLRRGVSFAVTGVFADALGGVYDREDTNPAKARLSFGRSAGLPTGGGQSPD
jgi:hypothetical protein